MSDQLVTKVELLHNITRTFLNSESVRQQAELACIHRPRVAEDLEDSLSAVSACLAKLTKPVKHRDASPVRRPQSHDAVEIDNNQYSIYCEILVFDDWIHTNVAQCASPEPALIYDAMHVLWFRLVSEKARERRRKGKAVGYQPFKWKPEVVLRRPYTDDEIKIELKHPFRKD
jgi:hypothetical protein